MCGIFGYIGQQNNAARIILEGLKRLEYRGYDSWGIAIKNQKGLLIEKHIGKIGTAKVNLPGSNLGIGHTRWATHGGVTVANAHPHLDCSGTIALMHNGIVENFQELKNVLLTKGHVFKSETDTEVVVHLLEEVKRVTNKSHFERAFLQAFNKLTGLNAIIAIDTLSGHIMAAKNGSPLIVGIGEGEYFIASDASGIIKHTKKVLFLEDHQMVVLGEDLRLLSLPGGKKLIPKYETIDWKSEKADKGKFDHFMLKEIYDQPKVIRNIAQNFDSEIKHLSSLIQRAKGTFLIGAGTAFHACMGGVYLFAKIAHEHVNTASASEFNYLEDFLNDKSLVIALSQSGETIDVVEPLNRAREKGATIVAIVNNLGSSIYRMADYKLLLGAGPEIAVASTKAYIAKLSVFLLLANAINGEMSKIKKELLLGAAEIDRLLGKKSIAAIKKIASFLHSSEHIYTIGRGVSYSTALEAALKIKEVSYIHTEGLAGGELKHGTLALVSKGTPCLAFVPADETFAAMISNATEIRSRGGIIIGISPVKSSVFDFWIEVKNVGWASMLVQIVPAQLLAYYLALEKRHDPDKPRNLAKSVTVK